METLKKKWDEIDWDDPEFKKSVTDYFDKISEKDKVNKRWVKKIKVNFGDNIDSLIQVVCKKYSTENYQKRYYERGREPETPLYWLLLEYAEKHCKKCRNKKYWNMFTVSAYYIGSYVISQMNGQGSVVKIQRINCDNYET